MRRFLGWCLLVWTLAAGGDVYAQAKIGTVDFNRAMNDVDEGKKALEQMEAHFAPKKAALEAKKQELDRLQDELRRQSVVLSEQARKEKEGQIQQKYVDLQRESVQAQDEAAMMFNQVNQDLKDKLQVEVGKIAKKKGLDIVIEKSLIMYEAPGMDITDELIKSYNASASAGTATK